MIGEKAVALCPRDLVVATLYAASVPIADMAATRSGLAVSPNGRVVRVALYANDGGLKRPVDVWGAYLTLAIALLREIGLPVTATKPGLEVMVGSPPARREEAAHG